MDVVHMYIMPISLACWLNNIWFNRMGNRQDWNEAVGTSTSTSTSIVIRYSDTFDGNIHAKPIRACIRHIRPNDTQTHACKHNIDGNPIELLANANGHTSSKRKTKKLGTTVDSDPTEHKTQDTKKRKNKLQNEWIKQCTNFHVHLGI